MCARMHACLPQSPSHESNGRHLRAHGSNDAQTGPTAVPMICHPLAHLQPCLQWRSSNAVLRGQQLQFAHGSQFEQPNGGCRALPTSQKVTLLPMLCAQERVVQQMEEDREADARRHQAEIEQLQQRLASSQAAEQSATAELHTLWQDSYSQQVHSHDVLTCPDSCFCFGHSVRMASLSLEEHYIMD